MPSNRSPTDGAGRRIPAVAEARFQQRGLRLAYREHPGALTAIALTVRAGARFDGRHPGLAHMAEHMLFQGTEGLDQIALSVPTLGEVWILDHGTTRAEAASDRGGRRGRGGEILYRWGNPSVYGRGDASERRLVYQHDARWVPRGHPGEGRLRRSRQP